MIYILIEDTKLLIIVLQGKSQNPSTCWSLMTKDGQRVRLRFFAQIWSSARRFSCQKVDQRSVLFRPITLIFIYYTSVDKRFEKTRQTKLVKQTYLKTKNMRLTFEDDFCTKCIPSSFMKVSKNNTDGCHNHNQFRSYVISSPSKYSSMGRSIRP